MKALCYGSLNLDHVYHVPELIRPGETLSVLSVEQHCGGKGFNQAVAAAKAGLSVTLAGCIGPDGEIFRKICAQVGVDTTCLSQVTTPTGNAVIQVSQRGENCILLYGGANREVSCAQIDRVLDQFQAGDLLIVQNEISHLPYLVSTGAARGLRIAINPSPMDPDITPDLLSAAQWLFVNEVEAKQLCGTTRPEDCLPQLNDLCPGGSVILTLGSDGSCYRGPEGTFYQPAFCVQAVDTTAAGATFTGYFLACVLSGSSPEQALYTASKAAALAVTRRGAYDSIPWKDEVAQAQLSLADL